jgi:hypothetical protein
MVEFITNLHMHTVYSDGHATHAEIAEAALRTGMDVIFTTDHNIYVHGIDRYYQKGDHKLLLLVGEEVHDVLRQPQKNHLLIYGANKELSGFAGDPQRLINQVNNSGGLAFIAHPVDPALETFGEPDLSWVSWDVQGYAGIELWNGLSEMKSVVHNYLDGIFYAFFPQFMPHGPLPETLQRWDNLLSQGKKIVAIGGADAHALPMRLGPLHRTLFPYEYHFRSVNTHLLVPAPLGSDVFTDRRMILTALRQGHAFVGCDLPASTRGFNFTARGRNASVLMGDEIELEDGVTFQIRLPQASECRLLRDGQPLKTWRDKEFITHITNQPGIYRVECYIQYLGVRRGWIFSNPIYVKNS